MPHSHWYIPTPLAHKGIEVVLYISAWGYALLVSTGWAIPGASEREASDSAGFHAFFMSEFFRHAIKFKVAEVLNLKNTLLPREYKIFQQWTGQYAFRQTERHCIGNGNLRPLSGRRRLLPLIRLFQVAQRTGRYIRNQDIGRYQYRRYIPQAQQGTPDAGR